MPTSAPARSRRSCPSCATSFTPDRSNQRYCTVTCRQYGSNVRRGLSARIAPDAFRKRRNEGQLRAALEAPHSGNSVSDHDAYLKLCNANDNTMETNGPKSHFRPPTVPGWTGQDGDRRHRVFLPFDPTPLSRLQCRQIGVKYPAIDRGVYRVI